MRILGIDPGTATTGYGVIDVPDDIMNREFEYGIELVDYGNISTSKDDIMPKRLVQLHHGIEGLIEKYKPDLISVELLFFGINHRTAMAVGQARGVIMLSAGKHNVPIHEYTGLQVKLMIAGAGRADKKLVHEGVRKFLGSKGEKYRELTARWKGGHADDAIDAVAIAITHVLKLAAK
jgi:crossover junction endodeoxyribonuclease RuvC